MELPAKLQEYFLRSDKSNVNQLGVTQTLVFSSSEQDWRAGCGSHSVYIYIYIYIQSSTKTKVTNLIFGVFYQKGLSPLVVVCKALLWCTIVVKILFLMSRSATVAVPR